MVRFGPEVAASLIKVGIAAANDVEEPMAVAVVDAAGALVAFGRTIDATPAAVDCAPAKARTALWFRRPTAATVERAERRPEVYATLIGASPQPLVLSMGGILLVDAAGIVVGAVAAAGAQLGATDVEVADMMVERWRSSQGEGGAPDDPS